jgi:pyruvate formate lyase activating enzyme
MKVGGLRKFSLIDYPGKIAAVVFTQGCNFKCPFCHNPELTSSARKSDAPDVRSVLSFLSSRRGRLEGVVISGGEPTIQKGLAEFIWEIRSMGFSVKLDTNGSNPDVLEELKKEGFLDYVSMDIKSSPEKYAAAVKTDINIRTIERSISMIKDIPCHEFRTTAVPGIVEEDDITKIAQWLSRLGADKNFFIQGFRPGGCLDSKFDEILPYGGPWLASMEKKAAPYFKNLGIRS